MQSEPLPLRVYWSLTCSSRNMREFVKSFSSLMLAMSLFSLKQAQNAASPRDPGEGRGPAEKAMDSVTNATVNQFGETLRSTFHALDNVQRGVVGLGFALLFPFGGRGRRRADDQAGVHHIDQTESAGTRAYDYHTYRSHSWADDHVVSAADVLDPGGR